MEKNKEIAESRKQKAEGKKAQTSQIVSLIHDIRYKTNARRYRLHYRIRKQGFLLKTVEKTIYLKANQEPSKQVKTLRNDYDYMIQLNMGD